MLKDKYIDFAPLIVEQNKRLFCLFSTNGKAYGFTNFDTFWIGKEDEDIFDGERTSQKVINGKIVYVRE